MELCVDSNVSRMSWFLVAAAWSTVLVSGCGQYAGYGEELSDREEVNLAREIEEADIVKYVDGYFYLANQYTGLHIIDGRNMDQPRMRGSLPLAGRTVELIIRDDHVFIHTSADFYRCAGTPVGFSEEDQELITEPTFNGSRLWVVDISDKSTPELVSTLDGDLFVTATRRVGDVIYVAGYSDDASSLGTYSEVYVSAINIADPAATFIVETIPFTGTALDIHVSSEAMYVFGRDPELTETTLVTYVDISDEAGDIRVRDQFRVPGHVDNRFFVDEYDETFRIITQEYDNTTYEWLVALYTYDVSNPDNITRAGELSIIRDEDLRSVRFDGTRAYAVTFRQVDPLFVLDVSDPSDPAVTGELEVPGYSTHLVALGDRLVGVGFDDTSGVRPAVSLYDVSDPNHPRQLSRLIVGESGTYNTASEATVDEKAFKVLEDLELILLPVSTFDDDTGEYLEFLQIIDFQSDQLQEEGIIDHLGLVRRADVVGERLWLLSDLAFQTVDIDDLRSPASLALLEIISEQELLDAGLSACVDSARFSGVEVFQTGGGFGGGSGFFLFDLIGSFFSIFFLLF